MAAPSSAPATVVSVPSGSQRVLATLRGANMNTTADQALTIPASVTAWVPTAIIVTNTSLSLSLAAGGIYPAASKAGTALVANTQLYAALSGGTILLPLTLVAGALLTRYTINTLYLSLTTAQGSAATADVYVVGTDLS